MPAKRARDRLFKCRLKSARVRLGKILQAKFCAYITTRAHFEHTSIEPRTQRKKNIYKEQS